MKFTVGQWVTRPGFDLIHPQQVFDASYENNELTVFAYTKPAAARGGTIDQATFTLRFSATREDTIDVSISHFDGIRHKGPEFKLFKQENFTPRFFCDENVLRFSSGRLEAVIHKDSFYIDYLWDGKRVTGSPFKAQANITDDSRRVFTREQLTLAVGETVYGLGERFTPFTRNGQVVDMWNEDGGSSSEISYKNIPFYLTGRNYGVFVRHTEAVSFEVASEHVERVQFSVPGEKLSYTVIGGDSMGEVVMNYNRLTGIPALPPAWSFGLWLSTSFTTDYDERTVNGFLDGMASRELPLHVFHFDCFWMKGCEWCNFTWDNDTFPDPRGMLARLKERGLKICVWINPYIAQKSPLFKEGMERRYLLETKEGNVWQWDRWQAGMGIVDFTNPDACAWYQGKLKALIDMGVDCFKTDFGERIPDDAVYFDGSDAVKMHNYYSFLYNRCVFSLLERELGKDAAVVFARSATAGGQQFPVHWGGDCWGTYESMAESLRGGLSLCMSGFGYWSHDIGGFENTAKPDLYKRWIAFGLLSTHSRLHGSKSYRVPWHFDEQSVDVLRFFTNLRCTLMPYLWGQAMLTSTTGYPMMRSMAMEFTDIACKTIDTQYMLGENLLVAPIFSDTGLAQYYLPEGTWVNFITGDVRQGGRYYEEVFDYFSLPLFIKPGSIIPVGASDSKVVYDYAADAVLHVSPHEDGMKSGCVIYDGTGNITLRAEIAMAQGEYRFSVESEARYKILLLGVTADTEFDGFTTERTNKGLLLEPIQE